MLHHIERYPEIAPSERVLKTLGEAPTIHPSSRIYDSHIGTWTDIGPNCIIGETVFGDYSYCDGDVSMIYTEVGKFCSIASHVRINPGNHPMERVTQHHMTYRRREYGFSDHDDAAFFEWRRAHKCFIGHDVWIGHAATIMPGVVIGTGAVIGSGAVVTKDVEPYAIAVGIPARPIRKRFYSSIIDRLLAIAWWNWDRAKLEACFDDLLDINTFIEKHSGTH